MLLGGGGGGEIPKGGRAGRARSLGIWPRGDKITGGGGGEIPGTPGNAKASLSSIYSRLTYPFLLPIHCISIYSNVFKINCTSV